MSSIKRQLNPYLMFDGNCKEAMEFYRGILGGEAEYHTYASMPGDVPDEHKERVMHVSLRVDGFTLMASDTLPGQSPAVVPGNTVTLALYSKDLEEGKRYFQELSEGGTVLHPFDSAFWGGHFGMLTDRYGMHWSVSAEEHS